jgi:hypothetical protein
MAADRGKDFSHERARDTQSQAVRVEDTPEPPVDETAARAARAAFAAYLKTLANVEAVGPASEPSA